MLLGGMFKHVWTIPSHGRFMAGFPTLRTLAAPVDLAAPCSATRIAWAADFISALVAYCVGRCFACIPWSKHHAAWVDMLEGFFKSWIVVILGVQYYICHLELSKWDSLPQLCQTPIKFPWGKLMIFRYAPLRWSQASYVGENSPY